MNVNLDRILMRTKDLLLLAGIAWACFSYAGDLLFSLKTMQRQVVTLEQTVKEQGDRISRLEAGIEGR